MGVERGGRKKGIRKNGGKRILLVVGFFSQKSTIFFFISINQINFHKKIHLS
jgi:hypothetical protein